MRNHLISGIKDRLDQCYGTKEDPIYFFFNICFRVYLVQVFQLFTLVNWKREKLNTAVLVPEFHAANSARCGLQAYKAWPGIPLLKQLNFEPH